MINIVKDLVTGLASPVVDAYKTNQNKKIAKEQLKTKINLAKMNSETKITITDAEWESIAAEKTDSTWKDEYVTIVMTSPIVLFLLGGILSVALDTTAPMEAVNVGLDAISRMGVDMGSLILPVVYAAVGLKLWRSS